MNRLVSALKKIVADIDDVKGEVILLNVDSEIYEDNYNEGEGEHTGAGLSNDRIAQEFKSLDEALKYLSDNYGIGKDRVDYEIINTGELQTSKGPLADHSHEQNGGWFEATPDEIKAWKKGDLKLYVEHYFIKFREV